ncbi:hypothetical protein O181_027741 [Austropuccinia psidii MF-1]|uniref:Uncharacterized protein n=1 Tax=Austropuccinia psidii MF-1 TaxID=1389203 RepID=A0A9Q3CMW3_9BASI|nr:hypothetical protein [Austropuccinia psidii MF-1]
MKKRSLDVIIHMPLNQEQCMPVHKEKKLWMMRMRKCLPITVKQMINQGGTISWCMRRALSQIVSSTTLKFPSPRVCLNNPRSDSKDHNVGKHASQKEKQRWLKVELP